MRFCNTYFVLSLFTRPTPFSISYPFDNLYPKNLAVYEPPLLIYSYSLRENIK